MQLFSNFGSNILLPVQPVVAILCNDVGRIEQARIGTDWVLRKYEFTGSPREIRNWLLAYHGEADNQQVFYSFVGWGLTHQKDFIKIVEGIDASEKSRVMSQLAWGIVDSVQLVEFENSFKDYDSQVINELKTEIQRIKY
ncbi:MAG: hypothetical protein HC846_10895 [Blastocatellia bacterium]|nr:hypothetical protein [Blastocatellia bacterium]